MEIDCDVLIILHFLHIFVFVYFTIDVGFISKLFGAGPVVHKGVQLYTIFIYLWRWGLVIHQVSLCRSTSRCACIITQQTKNISVIFVQYRPNVFDVGLPVYICYTHVSCLLGMDNEAQVTSFHL